VDGRATARVYALYAAASALSFILGLALIGVPLGRGVDLWNVQAWAARAGMAPVIGVMALLISISIRKAALPFHSWLPPVFAAAPPGPVLVLVAPMVGAYAFIRFAVPLLGDVLGDRGSILAPLALLTAAYAAGLAFVQRDLRRIVAWIATSQSALVLLGLECPEGAGLTGGVLVWLSAAAGMTGLGLSAWMLEARFGALDVVRPRGLYRRCRALALVFLLSGLSLVGLPGTIGFASGDLLLSAVLHAFPVLSLLLFFAVALNGFTLLRTYMRLFHGPAARGPELALLPREWLALLVPLALVISQGLHPAPLVRLGAEASQVLLERSRTVPLHD
jgi:NADH-quinone oxidoreductase subunit M